MYIHICIIYLYIYLNIQEGVEVAVPASTDESHHESRKWVSPRALLKNVRENALRGLRGSPSVSAPQILPLRDILRKPLSVLKAVDTG